MQELEQIDRAHAFDDLERIKHVGGLMRQCRAQNLLSARISRNTGSTTSGRRQHSGHVWHKARLTRSMNIEVAKRRVAR